MRIALRFCLLIFLLLSACAPQPDRGVLIEPPMPVDIPLNPTPEERVVTMITPTRTALAVEATYTPVNPPATKTPISAVFPGGSLEDMGIESAVYRDEAAGFAFDFPAGWIITEPAEEAKANSMIYTTTFLSHQVERGPKQQEGLAPGQASLDVTVIKNGAASLEEAAEQRRAQINNPDSRETLLSEERLTLTGGLEVVRFQLDSMSGPAAILVTSINGNMVMITGLGDLNLFIIIAGSLREEGT